MSNPNGLETALLRSAIQPEVVRDVRRYHLRWLVVVSGCAAFVAIQAWAGPKWERGAALDGPTMIHAMTAIVVYVAALLSPRRALLRRRPRTPAEAVELVQYFARGRIALISIAAIAGWLVCLLGVSSGRIDAEPSYWANASTTAVLLAYSVVRWPTAERLAGILDR